MADATDMSTPVTRGELRAEIAPLATKAELRAEIAPLATKAELQSAIAPLATKAEIALLATKAEIALLATKAELRAEVALLATKVELDLWGGALLARMDAFEHRLLAEVARHTNATFEAMSTQISVIDEKYADLPPRVSRLEGKMFTPERR
jgi:hypothetical protein